ncbi:hypothetical protein BDW60DRAFT_205317 [Aspergillus nidulans var. acristatus]
MHVDVPLLGGLSISVTFSESLSKSICFEKSMLSSITRLQLYAPDTGAKARPGEHAAVRTKYTCTTGKIPQGRFNLRILLVAVLLIS